MQNAEYDVISSDWSSVLCASDLRKPWASYRMETNLGSIALTVGRDEDAVRHFEAAFELRPDDANAIANLALARTVQGRFEEGMALARQALTASPRADYAVAYLVQAAERSDWRSDEHTSELPSLMRISYAVFCLIKKNKTTHKKRH